MNAFPIIALCVASWATVVLIRWVMNERKSPPVMALYERRVGLATSARAQARANPPSRQMLVPPQFARVDERLSETTTVA